MITAGYQRVIVFNRHLHRAESLVRHFGRSASHMELRAMTWHESVIESELSKTKVLINASAVADSANTSPINAELLPPELLVLDLIYWPTVQMILWGFITLFLVGQSGWVAQAAGVFLSAVLLWDTLFRGQLGVSLCFLEEMYARHLGHLFVSPLRPVELVAANFILDAEQVKRLAAGLSLDEPAAAAPPSTPVASREKPPKERPTAIVPPLPPRPVTQE